MVVIVLDCLLMVECFSPSYNGTSDPERVARATAQQPRFSFGATLVYLHDVRARWAGVFWASWAALMPPVRSVCGTPADEAWLPIASSADVRMSVGQAAVPARLRPLRPAATGGRLSPTLVELGLSPRVGGGLWPRARPSFASFLGVHRGSPLVQLY